VRSKSSFYGRKEPQPAISPILLLSFLWAKSTSTHVFAHTWRSRRAFHVIILWAKRTTTHHFAHTPSLPFMGEIDLYPCFRPYLALPAHIPNHPFGAKRPPTRYFAHIPSLPFMGEIGLYPCFRPYLAFPPCPSLPSPTPCNSNPRENTRHLFRNDGYSILLMFGFTSGARRFSHFELSREVPARLALGARFSRRCFSRLTTSRRFSRVSPCCRTAPRNPPPRALN